MSKGEAFDNLAGDAVLSGGAVAGEGLNNIADVIGVALEGGKMGAGCFV